MKKIELQSIKECVKNGDFSISHHSYGTCSAGYLVNFKLLITSKEHQNKFNRSVYYIGFSSRAWYVVKYVGVFYNYHYNEKYKQYNDKIEAVIFGDKVVLSEKLS